MKRDIITDLQDLTWLRWSHIRTSSGTAGTLLKSQSILSGNKIYYKLSSYEPGIGITGHECINEIIVDRLLTILGIEHLHYSLIHAQIELEGTVYTTYLCASQDFKKASESKIALDDFYRANAFQGESHYDFCIRMGWKDYIDTMIAVDYLILNRDRHGTNIEVLRNARAHSLRIAPLFDHGLSLLFSCHSPDDIRKFDVMEDKRCQNFIGTSSCLDNLHLIQNKKKAIPGSLQENSNELLFEGLENVLSKEHRNAIWNMIYRRYKYYESL